MTISGGYSQNPPASGLPVGTTTGTLILLKPRPSSVKTKRLTSTPSDFFISPSCAGRFGIGGWVDLADDGRERRVLRVPVEDDVVAEFWIAHTVP